MHEREQTTKLIWAIRAAAAAVLAIAMALSTAMDARAGIGFDYARSSSKVAFAGGTVAFEFQLRGAAGRDLNLEVVRKGAGIVTIIPATALPPATPLALGWNGLNTFGKPAKPGSYAFRVRNPRNGKIARLKRVRGKRTFALRSSVFPVRGPYSFGGAGAGFGAPRSGHSHQGQDVLASCGIGLVTPQRGKVVANGFQASAGNYVVVELSATREDAVFMHLQKPSWAAVGTPLFAGQQIGRVGATGNAQGCHLHFELWTAPGWYVGGAPYDPLPALMAWANG
jgi:murein DD-endopeptidase MepM/ murein hydrolase activator NlpD